MDDTASPTLPIHQASTSELVKLLSEQVSVLVRDELKLASLEMKRKGQQAGLGVGMFGAAGIGVLYGVGCLIACVVLAIAHVVSPWLAALIVGAALLMVSGAAALAGRGRLRKAVPPMPEHTVESVKADIEEIREKAHHDHHETKPRQRSRPAVRRG
ncbi:MAG TPA: phage holin family protein [Streptosporangiaceae bacterium]|nr:phage holin family protein [Streptosporangiaceae bacterium]